MQPKTRARYQTRVRPKEQNASDWFQNHNGATSTMSVSGISDTTQNQIQEENICTKRGAKHSNPNDISINSETLADVYIERLETPGST